VTVFEGDVQASSVQVEGDTKGLVYGFQSAQGDVWVGQWPGDTEAVKVASRAQLGCLALDGARVLVAVWERPPDRPVSEAVVYAFDRAPSGSAGSAAMSSGDEIWRPSEPAVWPEVGERCALLPSGGGQFSMLLRARNATDSKAALDLWWLPSFKEGRPLGFSPRIPKVLGKSGERVGLSVVSESGGARTMNTLWVHIDSTGGLVSDTTTTPPPLLAYLEAPPSALRIIHNQPGVAAVAIGADLYERPGAAAGLHLLIDAAP
jgi:hypothetical protein